MLRNKSSQKYSDLHPKRKLYSQNFLKDKSLIFDLVNNSTINEKDVVIEIGPGKGIITKFLLQKAGKVIGIEIDEELVEKLKEKFKNETKLNLIKSDIKTYKLPSGKYKVFSNIPFNITSEILNKLLNYRFGPEEAYLIVQLEAARRYIGNPFIRENLVSIINKPFFDFEIYHEFIPSDFDPVPNVKPIMLRIIKKSDSLIKLADQELYEDFLTYAFVNQKERLNNSLKQVFTFKQFSIMSKMFRFDLKANASDLDFEQWMGIFSTFLNKVPKEKQSIVKGYRTKFKLSK